MEAILNYPTENELDGKMYDLGTEEYYLHKVIDEQHIVLRTDSNSPYKTVTHYLQYIPEKKVVALKSKYEHRIWMMSIPLVALLALIIYSTKNQTIIFLVVLVALTFFIGIYFFRIRIKAKEIERELIIRINHIRRNEN